MNIFHYLLDGSLTHTHVVRFCNFSSEFTEVE